MYVNKFKQIHEYIYMYRLKKTQIQAHSHEEL